MNKIVTSAVILMTMVGTAQAELSTPPTSYPYAASTLASARLREGPTVYHKQIDTLHKGERLTILSCESVFCYAERQGGLPSGWVHYELILPIPQPASPPPVIMRPSHDMTDVLTNTTVPHTTFKF